jgi:hypothetical protein
MRFIIVKLPSMVLREVRVKLRVKRVIKQRAEEGLNVLLPFTLLFHRACLLQRVQALKSIESSL